MRHLLKRAQEIIAKEGGAVLFQRLWLHAKRRMGFSFQGNFTQGYERWVRQFDQPLSKIQVDRILKDLNAVPTFSIIVPVYNVDEKWLRAMIDSVINQSYPHWQLCLVDDASTEKTTVQCLESLKQTDPRIVIQLCSKNGGISTASNTAIELASGEYLALLDHDDLLAKDALLFNAMEISNNPEIELLYSDEDKISPSGKRTTPFFKPDYSPELLHNQNYIGHFVVIKKAGVLEAGGFRSKYDGAQDYDLLLRICKNAKVIKHIPRILYHWREIPGSTAAVFSSKSYADDAGLLALQSHFSATNQNAKITKGSYPGIYKTRYAITEEPLVSIILPFKDQLALLDKCLTSIFHQTQWPNIEVIAIDNNSEPIQSEKFKTKWEVQNNAIRFVNYRGPFNYSKICNYGVNLASGEYIVLLNSDVEVTSENWIESLLGLAQQSNIGAVGAKLLFPNQTIQHAGIVVGIDGGAGHPYNHFPANHRGYFLRLGLDHNVSAVTGALLMISKKKYEQVNGLDEALFGVAYNDIDFCLKLLASGYNNVLTPGCQGIHFESSSRGYDVDAEKQSRHDEEKQRLRKKWGALFESGDPFYNPNLSLLREDYSLNFNIQLAESSD